MAGKFSLAEVLANVEREKGVACAPENVSNSDTGREQIEYIDIVQLDDDPNNFYELARLKVIRENLDAQWKFAYERGKLTESTAYTLAQMPSARQRVIYGGLTKRGAVPGSVQEHVIRCYGESLAQAEAVECTTYGHGPCLNREAMQEKIMGRESWAYNSCRQCCEQCSNLVTCKSACPLLADKIKQLKADAKAQREQDKRAQEEKVRPQVEAIQRIWKRFGEARAAAGKSVEECYQAANVHYTEADGQKHEKLERLEEKCTTTTDLPCGFAYYLTPFQAYARLADLLGVSLDYLLCRTAEPAGFATQPEGQLVICGWMPGGTLPHQPCDVVADFALDGDTEIRMTCNFDGRAFRHQSGGETIDFEPVRWMVLPPVEEDQKSRPGAGAAGQD